MYVVEVVPIGEGGFEESAKRAIVDFYEENGWLPTAILVRAGTTVLTKITVDVGDLYGLKSFPIQVRPESEASMIPDGHFAMHTNDPEDLHEAFFMPVTPDEVVTV